MNNKLPRNKFVSSRPNRNRFRTLSRQGIMASLLFVFSSQLNAADQSVSEGGDIQAAIDSVASSGGGTVSLASGTYMLSSSIKMKSNVTLEGVGTMQLNESY